MVLVIPARLSGAAERVVGVVITRKRCSLRPILVQQNRCLLALVERLELPVRRAVRAVLAVLEELRLSELQSVFLLVVVAAVLVAQIPQQLAAVVVVVDRDLLVAQEPRLTVLVADRCFSQTRA